MLVAEGLCKKFGQRTVVNHVSFNIQQGGCFALLGPNGAGSGGCWMVYHADHGHGGGRHGPAVLHARLDAMVRQYQRRQMGHLCHGGCDMAQLPPTGMLIPCGLMMVIGAAGYTIGGVVLLRNDE